MTLPSSHADAVGDAIQAAACGRIAERPVGNRSPHPEERLERVRVDPAADACGCCCCGWGCAAWNTATWVISTYARPCWFSTIFRGRPP
jgi:hypothetical protein